MIIAKQKPIEEIISEITPYKRILILGCNECVTVCEAGGKKEVEVLASALRLHYMTKGQGKTFGEATLERQCDREYLEEIRGDMDDYDAVVSLACGVGVQFAAETYTATPCCPGWTPSAWGPMRPGGYGPSAVRPAAPASWPGPGASARWPGAPSGS